MGKPMQVEGHDVEIIQGEDGRPERVLIAGEVRKLSLRETKVRCGSARCKACRGGPSHGPYLVGTFSWKGKTRTIHLGKAQGPPTPSRTVANLAFDLLVSHIRGVLVAEGKGRMPRGKVKEILERLDASEDGAALAKALEKPIEDAIRRSLLQPGRSSAKPGVRK